MLDVPTAEPVWDWEKDTESTNSSYTRMMSCRLFLKAEGAAEGPTVSVLT